MLSNKHIQDFQALYKKHFGEDIDTQEALRQGTKLLRLMQLIYKPMKQAEFDAVQARKKELFRDDALSKPTN